MPQRRRKSPLKHAKRLRKIVAVLASHGFQNLAERANLGQFVLGRLFSLEHKDKSPSERLRLAFEKLGPTFVKFGQLLAARPDLVPQEFCDEFKKLHDQVQSEPFKKIETVLNHHFGTDWKKIFSEFNTEPLAAASIAQVYKAKLMDGSDVVVKVQRPAVEEIIEEDLNVLYSIADLLETYVPETQAYNPVGVVNEFFKTMELETNFVVEANNIRRFAENFENEKNIVIPKVYSQYTGKKVLVMEELKGIPLSHKGALGQEGIDPEAFLKIGLRAYLKMVFSYGLFHGDLHAGNMFVMPDSKVGLIDFGVVGRLNRKSQQSLANMLVALANEDYDRLAYEYMDLAPYREDTDLDLFARELRDIIAPYYGLSLQHMNVGRLLMDSAALSARHQLVLPSELVMFFKSIVVIEGMGRLISKDFNFLNYALEFAQEIVKTNYNTDRILKDLALGARDINSLLTVAPQQIKQVLKKVNSPGFKLTFHIDQSEEYKRSLETSANLLFLGLIIGSLIVSASLIYVDGKAPFFLGMPAIAAVGYGIAMVFGIAAFINYIKKS